MQEIAPQSAPADDDDNLRNAAQNEKEDDEEAGGAEDDKPEDDEDAWRSKVTEAGLDRLHVVDDRDEDRTWPAPFPKEDAWLNNMRNVPEGAKRALSELARAGVRVLLRQHRDDEEDQALATGEPIGVTFRRSGATADRPGFNAEFGRKALAQLLGSLPGVDDIDLRGTNVRDDDLEELRAVPKLAVLDLTDTPITDGGVAHLACLHELEWLSLEGTQIADAGLAQLRSMKKLGTLYLDGTTITDAGLKNLDQMEGLEDLNLARTKISDAGLFHLRDLKLHFLCLNGTRVTDVGLVHFKKGMPDLFSLDLWDTQVTRAGLEQLRDVTHLWGLKCGNTTYGGISAGTTIADNPATIEPATPKQIARLKEALWWLPDDSEAVCVAHGPFALSVSKQDEFENLDNSQSRFERKVRPAIRVSNVDVSALDRLTVALIIKGSRCARLGAVFPFGELAFEGCHIVVFKAPVREALDSFMAALAKASTKSELIGDTNVVEIDADIGKANCSSFIASPTPHVLLFADNRDDLAEMLARMANRSARRALDDDLPEWKPLDLGARQWAMRHYKHGPESEWPFVGVVYSLQRGDVAKVLYLSRSEYALRLAKRSWAYVREVAIETDVDVRNPEPNLIEVSYSVRESQNLTAFFSTLFWQLGEDTSRYAEPP